MNYTYSELYDKPMEQLEVIKKRLLEELQAKHKEKIILIGNILSLQAQIKEGTE